MMHYKCVNAFDRLNQGDTYRLEVKGRKKLLVNTRSGRAFTIYHHELVLAVQRGALVEVAAPMAPGLDCAIAQAQLAHTTHGFAY